MTNKILTRERDKSLEIVLNRPDKRNAIDLDMLHGLHDAVQQALRTEGLRSVVLRGEGSCFSAGIDVTALMSLGQVYGEGWLQRMRSITRDIQAVSNAFEQLEVPVIALLHGHCLGLGLELALACDMRFACVGTSLALPETRLGLIPDVGGSTRLARLVGPARAKDLIFTGRRISAETAERWGLVDRLVPADGLEPELDAWLEELSLAAPLAVGMAKRVIDGAFDLHRGLELEGWAQSQLVACEDMAEAMQAFMSKRRPEFKGR